MALEGDGLVGLLRYYPAGSIKADYTNNPNTSNRVNTTYVQWQLFVFKVDNIDPRGETTLFGKITKMGYITSSQFSVQGYWQAGHAITYQEGGYTSQDVVVYQNKQNTLSYHNQTSISINGYTYHIGDMFILPPQGESGNAFYVSTWDLYDKSKIHQNFNQLVEDNFGMKLLNLPAEWTNETQYDSAYGLKYSQEVATAVASTAKPNDYTLYMSIDITPPEPDDPTTPTDNNTYTVQPSYADNPSNYPGYTIDGTTKDPSVDKNPSHPSGAATSSAKDPTSTSTDETYNAVLSSGTSGIFITDKSGINQFWDFFWKIPDATTILLNSLTGMFDSLSAQVMSVQMLPFTVSDLGITTATQAPVIGRYVMDSNLPRVTDGWNEIDMGEVEIKPLSKKRSRMFFYDMKPYTTLHLSLPFLSNSIELDTNLWMGQTLKITLSVDLNTGKGLYKLKNGSGTPLQILECDVCTNIPYCLDDSISNMTQIAETSANALSSLAMTKSIPALQGVDFSPLKTVDSQSSATNVFGRYNAQLLIQRPIRNLPKYYGQTTGFRCLVTRTIQSVKGYLQIDNPKLNQSGSMTTSEWEEIISLLQSGVYHNYV